MKVFLNFVPLKTGGGLQVGLDFIENLCLFNEDWTFYLAYTTGTPFDGMSLPPNVVAHFPIGNRMADRMSYDLMIGARLVKSTGADVVYTQFGPALRNVYIPQVNGCAYSNLFYPEVDFWGGEKYFGRKFRKLIDVLRLAGVYRSTVTIFETPDLRDRCIKMLGLAEGRARCVLPSVSNLVGKDCYNNEVRESLKNLPKRKYIVYITRYHTNKNLELLIEAAEIMKRLGQKDYAFLLTLDTSDQRVIRYFNAVSKRGVQDLFVNFGPVPSNGCAELYRISYIAVLASNLESFSNNIAESWTMGVPLLITGLSWAQSLCGRGAHYFSHNDPDSLVKEIFALDKSEYRDALIENGAARLAEFPSSKDRFDQYIEIIRSQAA